MTRSLVRRWSIVLLPFVAACGLTDVLGPETGEDAEPEVRAFDDGVQVVDDVSNSLTLADGTVVHIDDGTERVADADGVVHTFGTAHEVLDLGGSVSATGEGEVQEDGTLMALDLALAVAYPTYEFEGHVVALDPADGWVKLDGGTKVYVGDETDGLEDSDGVVWTLAEVAAALDDDREVVAWGAGLLRAREPAIFDALSLGFEVSDPPAPVLVDFDEMVTGVWPDHGKFQLESGLYVLIGEGSTLAAADAASPGTIDELYAMVEDGLTVFATGYGEVVEQGFAEAVEVELRLHVQTPPPPPPPPPPAGTAFDGRVDFIMDPPGQVYLINGVMVRVLPSTVVTAANSMSPATVADAMLALEMNRRLIARGAGDPDPANPSIIDAATIEFEVQVETLTEDIAAIDPFGGGLILANGSFVLLTGQSVLVAADASSPNSLSGIDAALAAGDRVVATVEGYVIGGDPALGDPLSLEAITVTLQLVPGT